MDYSLHKKKASNHQGATMFTGARVIIKVPGLQYRWLAGGNLWPRNRTFLEGASMVIIWWIMYFCAVYYAEGIVIYNSDVTGNFWQVLVSFSLVSEIHILSRNKCMKWLRIDFQELLFVRNRWITVIIMEVLFTFTSLHIIHWLNFVHMVRFCPRFLMLSP